MTLCTVIDALGAARLAAWTAAGDKSKATTCKPLRISSDVSAPEPQPISSKGPPFVAWAMSGNHLLSHGSVNIVIMVLNIGLLGKMHTLDHEAAIQHHA